MCVTAKGRLQGWAGKLLLCTLAWFFFLGCSEIIVKWFFSACK